MGRKPRIEYAGAVYHVMCRGNRQESVFDDDHDCKTFLDTLGVVCQRTGWRVHAYVLMGNHYHLLIETPEVNLVDGMRWLQGTYTKRFNARHKQWGHLFQGRYKALVVGTTGDYFATVSTYIHLNPARSKNLGRKAPKLSDYVWSSYPLYLSRTQRPVWLSVDRTLESTGFSDTPTGLRRYQEMMQKRVVEIQYSDKPWAVDERWEKIRRGWCFGSDQFRDEMVAALDGVMEGKRRDSFGGIESQKHDTLEAMRLLAGGIKKLGIKKNDLLELKKNDPIKKAVAWSIRKNTSVKNEWIAKEIQMGCVSNMSQYVSEVESAEGGVLCNLKKILK